MKNGALIFVGCKKLILAITVIWFGLCASAYCQQPDTTMLLLRQTPLNGGTITPEVGVHRVGLNDQITLTAMPKPGYQFVYWLGDVSDPTSNSTVAYTDTPKIIIAIFRQIKYEFLHPEISSRSAPGTRVSPGSGDYSRQGGSGIGGQRRGGGGWPRTPEPEEPPEAEDFPLPGPGDDSDDFPVPQPGDNNDDFPIPEPVPEPATLAILGLGGLVIFTGRRHKTKRVTKKN